MIAAEIPFNRSSLLGREMEYIHQTISRGQIAGDQVFSRKCQALLEGVLNVNKAMLTTSCTHALEACALLLNIQPGDEVIVPAFAFVSAANAFALRGAQVVFADIRPDTLDLDEAQLEALITPRTKAVVLIHYAGIACEMDAIVPIARRHSIRLVEDNAHGLFAKYRGRWLGTFGDLAVQSFHETKNITCGEGGALLINDPAHIARAEIIREKGTNRSMFFRGQIDKYTWVDVGSSYVMSDVLAAFLFAQLEVWQDIQARRRQIWERYASELSDWARTNAVRLPVIPPHCEQAYHMFYLLLPSLDARRALVAHLAAHGILAVFHYVPLHLSKFGARYGGKPGDHPVAEHVSDHLLRLPFFYALTDVEQSRVIEAVRGFST
ncbi:MAG: dTDP-4-amino-4,6-dideoxygalactose transaminase [Acidobacteriaceae bacterium]|nr:dTDP-4-amino-4,6-dideoxygalactose transaminase [Acidobacteriaceae bacterium]